jgi:predicted  nucleic acid-binding Zn-ribbon protein
MVKDLIRLLIKLQDVDSRIFEKSLFIDKVPARIYEVDEPLKQANLELEKIKQKNEGLLKKKKEKEKLLEEINEKIKKTKARVADIKTNKEYQAHLKEIESSETEISKIEEEILLIMEDLDNSMKLQKEKNERVKIEVEKINTFKKQLDQEVEEYQKELSLLKEERAELGRRIDPEIYGLYMTLINTGSGIAVTRTKNEICMGCNMNIPPQLFVEIKKNEEIFQCPQCQRILHYSEDLPQNGQ